MPTLKLRKNLILGESHREGHKTGKWILIYASIACGVAFQVLFIRTTAVPFIAQGYTVPIAPAVPLAAAGPATASLIENLNVQGLGAQTLGYVSHRYLTGSGTLVGFAGDNIQIFEYATDETASAEASAILKRAPRLTKEKESFFHLYLHGHLIGLYFGHNTAVMQAATEAMGNTL